MIDRENGDSVEKNLTRTVLWTDLRLDLGIPNEKPANDPLNYVAVCVLTYV
jgi:hypothetical protein